MKHAMIAVAIFAFLFMGPVNESRAAYPERPITLTVMLPAGGITDFVGRQLAEKLRELLGQPVVVQNKSGVALGVAELMRTRPDGYNLGFLSDNYLTISPHLSDTPFKSPEDLTTLAFVYRTPVLVVTMVERPWRTAKDLLDAGKATPGKIRIAGSGIGSVNHVNFVEMMNLAGSPLVYVPFPGAAPALAAFLGGHMEGLVIPPYEIGPHVASGKVKILGIFSETRKKGLPEVPTMREMGYDVTREINGLVIAPKGIPPAVVAALEEAIRKVTSDPEFVKKIASQTGGETYFRGSRDVAKLLAADFAAAKAIVERLNLRQQ